MLLPKKAFTTKGVGVHKEKLTSFELALRDAGIAQFNLVRVSSIYPPYCKMVPKEAGLKYLSPGSIVHVVIAESATNEPNRLIASSVGLAIPKNPAHHGYLSEHHSYGETAKKADDYCEDLAAEMLATILHGGSSGKPSPKIKYDKRKGEWRISSEIVKTMAVTQSAEGNKHGYWTTVIAACVFIM
ncbi:MAG: arginine decarboxylase, pyruvoyl-dependent [Candidatus Omnitrophica bacterium]|nr:arginine decarboxylase, pyruvoyl-dependent [Candidatus Omnitrophota bacterium]